MGGSGGGRDAGPGCAAARPRPTAVLGLSDGLALSALSAAHWMGLWVPGDVSVAGLDDLPRSEAAGLTSALVPYRPLGERAGDLLTALLAGGDPGRRPPCCRPRAQHPPLDGAAALPGGLTAGEAPPAGAARERSSGG